MAQVERLESKLSLLAFMGVFDELTEKVIPVSVHRGYICAYMLYMYCTCTLCMSLMCLYIVVK